MADSASKPDDQPVGITRQVLERDGLRKAMQAFHPDVRLLSDQAVRASLDTTLRARPAWAASRDGLWLFAYGSLLWNPCVAVAQRHRARLYGFHRDFRLRLTYGRGSPEAPGLMLGLVSGGSCLGVALQVAGSDPLHELYLVWRREMLTGVYRPRWVRLRSAAGTLAAVAFVVNPAHRCYCRRLEEGETVRLLATGHGLLGSSAAYLGNTVRHLDEQGIHDRRLRRLQARVAAWRGDSA